jgi:hypothetical protein
MTVGVVISAIDRASAPMKQIQGATSTLGRALESISSKAALAGAALHGVALATSGLSARLQQIGMTSLHAFAAFDDARALIASMPGMTKEALDKMQADAFAFTRQNKATLTDYYNTAYNILSAGIPEALATYATEVSIKVGQATRGSADEAGEAVAILFNNMRDGSREAGSEFARMGDIITATQQRFQLKFQSAPGFSTGRDARSTARNFPQLTVSIRARFFNRARPPYKDDRVRVAVVNLERLAIVTHHIRKGIASRAYEVQPIIQDKSGRIVKGALWPW